MSAIPVEVANVRDQRRGDATPADVYIGRGTPFGNGSIMRDESMRDQVCIEFDDYFFDRVENDSSFVVELDRLVEIARAHGRLKLLCHCKPKRCHGDTIADYLRLKLK